MRILVVPDSMKDALSAREAAQLIQESIWEVYPNAEVTCCPFSDGGEGLIDALSYAGIGRRIPVKADDPLYRPVQAEVLALEDHTFFIEMAQASGLERLSADERNPLYTSTFGTGQMIAYALQQGARKIFLGMGGSATHDLGCGMAKALGAKFYNAAGEEIDPTGGNLIHISRIDYSALQQWSKVSFYGVSDVTNSLLGEQGAARIYAAQKGADESIIKTLEEGGKHISELLHELGGKAIANVKGSGAAGGLGFGLVTFLHGEVLNGVEVLSDLFKLPQQIAETDVVITLEGKTDRQTLQGKAPYYVGRLAKKAGKTSLHFTGSWNGDEKEFRDAFDVIVPIQDRPMTVEESIKRVKIVLSAAVSRTFRLIKIGQLF